MTGFYVKSDLAQGKEHRAQSTGHRAWSMGQGHNREILVFESTDKGTRGDGDKGTRGKKD